MIFSIRCWQPHLEEKPGSSMIRDLKIIKIKYFSTRDMYVTRNTCNYMMHQDGLNIYENKLCSENKHFPVWKESTQTKPNINTWNIFNIQYNAITSGEKDSESTLSTRSLLMTKRRKEFWFGPSGIKGQSSMTNNWNSHRNVKEWWKQQIWSLCFSQLFRTYIVEITFNPIKYNRGLYFTPQCLSNI